MTVVIPVHNGAHVLPITAPEVRALPVDHIVYVDDGSTDETLPFLHAMADVDPRIDVVALPTNLGRAAARNRGVERVGSAIVLFLDADVAPLQGYAEAMAASLDASGAVAAVANLEYADLDPSDPYHRYLTSQHRGRAYSPAPAGGAARGSIPWRFFLSGAAAVHRDALLGAGGFPESVGYGEDLALACLLAHHAPDGLHPSDATAVVRDVGGLESTLEKLRAFASDLPRVLDACPSALESAGLMRLRGATASDRALLSLARSEIVARVCQRHLGRLPASLQPLAVRYLLAHTLATHAPPDALL